MNCPHDQIAASLDRWQEVHWQIHQIEKNYHDPDGVRYSFNALIRATKEIPQLLSMELQKRLDYRAVLKPKIEALRNDPLFALLAKNRDYVVHQGTLKVFSKGSIGTTEGKGWKIGFQYAVYPTESSDDAYRRFIETCIKDEEIRDLMGPDCDSNPMLQRVWLLPELPDRDFLDIAVSAWRTCGKLLSEIVVHLGGAPLDTELSCAHDPEAVRRKVYSAAEFFRIVDGIDIKTGEKITAR